MTGVEQFIERNSLDVEILHLKNSWIGIMVKPTSDSIILPHISNTTHSSTTPTPNHYKMLEWTDEKVQKFWNYESQFPENYFTYQVG